MRMIMGMRMIRNSICAGAIVFKFESTGEEPALMSQRLNICGQLIDNKNDSQ